MAVTLVRPPIYRELDDDAVYAKLMAAVREQEVEIQHDMRRKSRRFHVLRSLVRTLFQPTTELCTQTLASRNFVGA